MWPRDSVFAMQQHGMPTKRSLAPRNGTLLQHALLQIFAACIHHVEIDRMMLQDECESQLRCSSTWQHERSHTPRICPLQFRIPQVHAAWIIQVCFQVNSDLLPKPSDTLTSFQGHHAVRLTGGKSCFMSACTLALFDTTVATAAGCFTLRLSLHLYTSLPRTSVPMMRQSRLASFCALFAHDLSPAQAVCEHTKCSDSIIPWSHYCTTMCTSGCGDTRLKARPGNIRGALPGRPVDRHC